MRTLLLANTKLSKMMEVQAVIDLIHHLGIVKLIDSLGAPDQDDIFECLKSIYGSLFGTREVQLNYTFSPKTGVHRLSVYPLSGATLPPLNQASKMHNRTGIDFIFADRSLSLKVTDRFYPLSSDVKVRFDADHVGKVYSSTQLLIDMYQSGRQDLTRPIWVMGLSEMYSEVSTLIDRIHHWLADIYFVPEFSPLQVNFVASSVLPAALKLFAFAEVLHSITPVVSFRCKPGMVYEYLDSCYYATESPRHNLHKYSEAVLILCGELLDRIMFNDYEHVTIGLKRNVA